MKYKFEETFPDIFCCTLTDVDFIVRCFHYKVIEPAFPFFYALFFYRQLCSEIIFIGDAIFALCAYFTEWISWKTDGSTEIHNGLVIKVCLLFIEQRTSERCV